MEVVWISSGDYPSMYPRMRTAPWSSHTSSTTADPNGRRREGDIADLWSSRDLHFHLNAESGRAGANDRHGESGDLCLRRPSRGSSAAHRMRPGCREDHKARADQADKDQSVANPGRLPILRACICSLALDCAFDIHHSMY